ncbi:hypothetical protein [uncultured Jatrophihabitans sp.]|uniref:hypothetical protein n=1 Tax=uncultured Jatrophihabitans sp. TaxID=1610747 RepID=UPI0035C9795B
MRLRAISERRVRTAAALLGVVLAVSGLSACRTNVGTAATIDGHRLSENDVNDFVTESAKPIKSGDGSQSIAPKPFVVDILIERRLYPKILVGAGIGAPSAGQLTTLRRQYLAGASATTAVEKLGAVGYSSAMNTTIVDVQVMGTLLNQAQQQGKNLSTVVSKLKFPVSVNPRYGTWDSKTLRFSADVTSGLPGFLKLQSSSTTQS